MSPVSSSLRVLVVGPSALQDSIRDAIGGDGAAIDLVMADSTDEAVDLAGGAPVDAAIVTDSTPGTELATTIDSVHDHFDAVPVVAVLAADRTDATDALAAGADDCLRADLMVAHPPVALSRLRGVADRAGSTRTEPSEASGIPGLDPAAGSGAPVAGDSVTEAIFDAFPNGAVTLVGPDLTYRLAGGALFDRIDATPEDVIGAPVDDVPAGERDVFVEAYSQALDGTETATETTLGEMTLVLRTAPVLDADGSVIAAVGMTQEITERKRTERELKRRERILEELHVAMRDLYPPASPEAVRSFLVEFVEESFGFAYVSVKRFDEEAGVLRPDRKATAFGTDIEGPGVIDPGSGPLWGAYRTGESRSIDGSAVPGLADTLVRDVLAIPIGRFGLIVVGQRDGGIDAVDRDLIEMMATTATAVLETLKQERERSTLAGELRSQRDSIAELRTIATTTQAIQERITAGESRDAIESAVCAELIDIDPIEFVWIGRPQGRDTNLDPAAWAGAGAEYLDFVLQQETTSLPARRAAESRETQFVPRISERVHDDRWATEALSAGFRSVVSVPLLFDEVLYGVLTVYLSEDRTAAPYRDLLEDVASLLVTYGRLLEQRHPDAADEIVALEFTVTDSRCPLHRLAAETGTRIRFDTVAETDDDTVRILITVTDGDGQAVVDRAREAPDVRQADWFGDSDPGQVTLTLDRPFLAGIIGKHGGTLQTAVSGPSETRLEVTVPQSASTRPLLEALTDRYADIDLTAQQTRRPDPGTDRLLTDRQREILTAAYHGGYYDIPRTVTGEDLAKSFDISGPAVSNHLKSAHRAVVAEFLDTTEEIKSDNEDLP
ncbi:bacterio-opsin activator domain-containing protein [Halococcoides cellulosivorans]|uniref:PAC domain-containing protein n=1 Tax=Halococcoides cellulosivorans TaxID=1679096 RepID=A0A2R4WXS5_9EURY|nr:bacterio-opsin activator domain-containing protein [Halococcoides cellulosivorans]AWB26320.1 hypothetical protein HARCEL1_00585 [Halococcoides cellulosivorans]